MVVMTKLDLSQIRSPSNPEFLRRRALTGYLCCDDEYIWEEIEQEEEAKLREAEEATKEANKPKLAVIQPKPSELASRFKPFLMKIFQNHWNYNQEQLDIARQNLKPELISPSHIDWDQRKQDTDTPSKSGQYTLNPETQNLDFEKARVFIPDPKTLKQFEGHSISELGQYLAVTYSTKYYIPGIEYWQYISQNQDKVSLQLKDSKNYYFYFGSILRHRSGAWGVLDSRWDGSLFKRDANCLGNVWHSNYRVVLLEM